MAIINDNIYFTKEKTKGRPRLILNEHGKELILKLSNVMCTDEEIADMLGCDIDTLKAKHNIEAFSESYKKGRSQAKSSLRKWQFQNAKNGNASLQIWLGKQYLGQTDKQEIEEKGNSPITINVSAATTKDAEDY